MAAVHTTGRTVTDAADRRKLDLARIHVLKAQLGLQDDEYRDLLQAIARVRSAAELDWTARRRVLLHLGKLEKAAGRARPMTSAARQQRLVRLLWHRLAEAGALRLAPGHGAAERDRALDAWIKRQTGVAALPWLDPQQLRGVIEHLKQWLARYETTAPAADRKAPA
jgi:hypothetical protein